MWSLLSFARAFAAPEILNGSQPDPLTDPPSITIVYSGEQRGEIGPCGCDVAPRGGLGRLARFVSDARSLGRPLLVVNTGAWLSSELGVGALSEGAVRDNHWLYEALPLVSFDALNVTPRDLPSLKPHPGLVSASHATPGAEGKATVAPYRVVEVSGRTVAITGVSLDALPYLRPEATVLKPPLQAVRDLLPELEIYDVVVVLAHNLPRDVPLLASLPGVDVVIEASSYTERWPARAGGEAVIVRSRDGGASAGVLSLWLDSEGRVQKVHDDAVRLDADMPSDRRVDRIERQQTKERTRRRRS